MTKTFALGDFWDIFRGKNFRKFKIREMLAAPKKKKKEDVIIVDDDESMNKSLLLKISPFFMISFEKIFAFRVLKNIQFAWKNSFLMIYNFQRQKFSRK